LINAALALFLFIIFAFGLIFVEGMWPLPMGARFRRTEGE
jgi:hypothetical protein